MGACARNKVWWIAGPPNFERMEFFWDAFYSKMYENEKNVKICAT